MAVIINWNGDIIQNSSSLGEWSTKGGVFTSAKGTKTYFPFPSSYNKYIGISGTYTIPANQANKPDLIAYTLYGSEDFWWLVYWMNNIIDPFQGLKAGTTILIANIDDVKKLLG